MIESSEWAEQLRRSVGDFVRATRASADTLPDAQAATLGYLDREGPATIAELARKRNVRHQSMRVTVDDLERTELVDRTPNPDDKRSLLITITDPGRAALGQARAGRASTIDAAIAEELTAEERRDLQRLSSILDRLTATITK
ncbi:MarR family transcriptional regulator [Mycetocola sp. JXN-3]|uniref:MarR family transcriptional regulator n=1 Tax=Mycetocola sp. JXN-3 TaxID=2116510 RepID=UPI00165D1DAC|nr:MarR family transcriptional regulator [Mycetocola sp. JXN-3]